MTDDVSPRHLACGLRVACLKFSQLLTFEFVAFDMAPSGKDLLNGSSCPEVNVMRVCSVMCRGHGLEIFIGVLGLMLSPKLSRS